MDYCYFKSNLVELGWSGEEVEISKLTSYDYLSINKKEKANSLTNDLIKVIISDSFDPMIWLKGLKGKVYLKKNDKIFKL